MRTLTFLAIIVLASFSLSAIAQSDSSKNMTVSLRGMDLSSEPLVIIDGNKQYIRGSAALKNIDPNNIESIEIFKADKAIGAYGTEGVDGVILIKTKSGKLSPISTKENISLFFRDINNATKTPLYVLDGKVVEEFSVKLIRQETIESVNVLKDVQARSLYGTRGVNGVVIITTKIKPTLNIKQ